MDKEKIMERYEENKIYQQQMYIFVNKLSEQTSGVFIKRNIFNMII